jgi:hypothetical protein
LIAKRCFDSAARHASLRLRELRLRAGLVTAGRCPVILAGGRPDANVQSVAPAGIVCVQVMLAAPPGTAKRHVTVHEAGCVL